ncbi:MAG: glutamate carboxypeptidase [Synechococcaceae cyanobacterium]|nr:glutamate carboxypeptidase [Synechococcaceae cyanobacterium]
MPFPLLPVCAARRIARRAARIALPLVLAGTALPVGAGDDRLLRQAREQRQTFLEELAALVAIDSGSEHGAGLARLAGRLAGRLRALGAEVELVSAKPAAGSTVVGRLRGAGQGRILMMIHMDTVYPEGEAQRRPFRTDGARAYGPGVADAKGGIVMILQALEIARRRGFDDYERITVVFNADEEISSVGSRDLIRRLASEHDVVLSYEPPPRPGTVITSTNGIAYLDLEVKGRSAHAGAAPETGRNAAVELAAQILRLQDLGDASRGTTVNWTVLEAGDRKNRIPDRARATADMRMKDLAEVERVRRDVRERIRRRHVPDTEVGFTLTPQRPPLPPNRATASLASLAARIHGEIGRTLEPIAMGFGTDAGFAHVPGGEGPAVLEGLGVVGGRLHSPDEWADLESIPARLYLSVRLLEELAARR